MIGLVVVLIRHHWRRYRVPLLPMMTGLAVFEFLITRMAPGPSEANWISGILAVVPPELLALAGNDLSPATPGGFLAIGYGHPFFMILMSAWVVRVASGVIAGEIGGGTMDLIAARPIARWMHVTAGVVAIAAGLSCLAGAAWCGSAAGLDLRDLGVSARSLAPVASSAWLLFVTWGALGLVVGASRRDGGSAMGWLSGIMATSFVVEYIARLWKPAAFLRPVSLFAYYAPDHIIRDGLVWRDTAILTVVALAATVVSMWLTDRRDF